jgi:threonine synthase
MPDRIPGLVGIDCLACGKHYADDAPEGPCDCGTAGLLELTYDLERVGHAYRQQRSDHERLNMLRYRAFLPLRTVDPALLPIVTQLRPAPRIARSLGLHEVVIKDETTQPTGSLKDRASAVAVARAAALGYQHIACASSGNAAIATAGMAAAQGLKAHVYVPKAVSQGKLGQARVYGAEVLVVDGDYDLAYETCNRQAAEHGWYNSNSGYNPYLVEGKKTCGLELAEQTVGGMPDWVAVPVGDGDTLAGIWKGLCEMLSLLGDASRPRLLAVQVSAAAPIYEAWAEGRATLGLLSRTSTQPTIAGAIAVPRPYSGDLALRAIIASGGVVERVVDEALIDAELMLARAAGVFAEPAAAAGLAGVIAARDGGRVEQGARVALVVTGSGLKDMAAIAPHLGDGSSEHPLRRDPCLAASTATRPGTGGSQHSATARSRLADSQQLSRDKK